MGGHFFGTLTRILIVLVFPPQFFFRSIFWNKKQKGEIVVRNEWHKPSVSLYKAKLHTTAQWRTSFHIVSINIYCFFALELFWKSPGSSGPLWLPKLKTLLCNKAKHPVGRPLRTTMEICLRSLPRTLLSVLNWSLVTQDQRLTLFLYSLF